MQNEDLNPSISRLETHLGYWLRFVSNHVSESFAKALQARHFTVAEWVALCQLYDHPKMLATELAELLGMTRGAVSKILVKLEAKGLIDRITQPEDKRSQGLSLTSEGRQILPELAKLADENDAYFFGCLDAQEKTQLRNLLQKLVQKHQWYDLPLD